jgi:hypothetical protein
MKTDLRILIVNRKSPAEENVVKDVFFKYRNDFDLIVFPPKESGECVIQCVSFKSQLRNDFSEIFNQHIDYEDEDDDFFDFDLQEIEMGTFYDMLDQRFEVSNYNLTAIESKVITL